MADTQVSPTNGNGHDTALVERARLLIEGTTLSQAAVAGQLDVSQAAVSRWQRTYGWVRPPGAPTQPGASRNGEAGPPKTDADRAAKLIDRLYRVCARQIGQVNKRAADHDAAQQERDARALASLARTVATLVTLERGDGVREADDADGVDPDEIRARLAHRLYALGQSEA